MAGLKIERVTVDDTVYELTQLGAREGRRVLARLARLAGPVLAELGKIPSLTTGLTPGEAAKKAISDTVLTSVLQKVAEAIEPETVDYLCDEMAKACGVVLGGGGTVQMLSSNGGTFFDQHFAGRYLHMTKWLWACLSFQFADFLDVMLRTSPQDAAAKPSA